MAGIPIIKNAYLNREESHLDAIDRIIDLAADKKRPLMARLMHLSESEERLDAFYISRVDRIKQKIRKGKRKKDLTGLSPYESLRAIHEKTAYLIKRQDVLYRRSVCYALNHQMAFYPVEDIKMLPAGYQSIAKGLYENNIKNFLRTIDLAEENLLSADHYELCGIEMTKENGMCRYSLLTIDKSLMAWQNLGNGYIMPSMQLILGIRQASADKKTVYKQGLFRMIRGKSRDIVRLDIDRSMDQEMKDHLIHLLGISEKDCFRRTIMPDLYNRVKEEVSSGDPLFNYSEPEVSSLWNCEEAICDQIKKEDHLVYYPWSDSKDLESFICQICQDPKAMMIRLIMDTEDDVSLLAAPLCHASRQKKLVDVYLAGLNGQKTRHFEEELTEAGANVRRLGKEVKDHCFLLQTIRNETDGYRSYIYIGSGYPHGHRRQTDFGYYTCDPSLEGEISAYFSLLSSGESDFEFEQLFISPLDMRERLMTLIEMEAGKVKEGHEGRIRILTGEISDQKIMDALYEASYEGVNIRLNVSDCCCLLPQVSGMSDHIQIHSLAGCLREHMSLFIFGSDEDPLILAGNMRLSKKDLDKRTNLLLAITDKNAGALLLREFDLKWQDNVNTYELGRDGAYEKTDGRGKKKRDAYTK